MITSRLLAAVALVFLAAPLRPYQQPCNTCSACTFDCPTIAGGDCPPGQCNQAGCEGAARAAIASALWAMAPTNFCEGTCLETPTACDYCYDVWWDPVFCNWGVDYLNSGAVSICCYPI